MLPGLNHPAAHPFRRFDDPLPMARNRSDPGNATTTRAHVGTVRPAQHADENEPAAAPLEYGPSRIALAGTEACDSAAMACGVREPQLQ